MLDFVPDAERLAKIFASATAPTFFLGAVAAFASLMTMKMQNIMERVRILNAIPDTDQDRLHLKDDLHRLMRRAHLLKDGIQSVLIAGVCATLLLAILFMTEFLGFKYAYGAGMLFLVATLLLGHALFKFAREARISLDEADSYKVD